MTVQKNRRMLVVELNEAEKYFLDKFVAAGLLPTFEKLLQKGKLLETRIGSWDPTEDKAWRKISPWIIWPSVYTGLTPKEHQIISFGQKTKIMQGQCLWDKLNAQGITTGVFGNLMSYPVRRNPYSLFYIPEALADTNDCFPETYKPIQEFFIYTARNYSENFLKMAIKATWKLMRGVIKGIPLSSAYEVLAQVPREKFKGIEYQRNRALLQAKLQIDIFKKLYKRYHPEFATIHLNPIAYMQHRYWRAAEPERFKDEVGDLDTYYFGDVETRKDYEYAFKDAILESFVQADQFLADLLPSLDENTLLVVMTALGQKPMDPVDEIHNPEIRLHNIEKLLHKADIKNCEILTQMNPDITLNFPTVADASLAAYKLSNLKVMGEFPLFQVEQIESQLFLEGTLPSNVWFLDDQAWIENKANEQILPLFDYVRVSPVRDQSTAHHRDNGWILFYGNVDKLAIKGESMDVTQISPLLLSYFNTSSSARPTASTGANSNTSSNTSLNKGQVIHE